MAGGSAGKGPIGCAASGLPICVDFEGAAALGPFSIKGNDIAVQGAKAAHGNRALAYSNLHEYKQAVIEVNALPGITDDLWGRFYLQMDAGAPEGHGALVAAFDQTGNWYELGFQFNSFHGNWHVPAGIPERWMNSEFVIAPKKWVCVEFRFNGGAAAETQIWADGAAVAYNQKADAPPIQKVTSFKKLQLGFMAYHGSSLDQYEGDAEPRATTMYIDDVALSSTRVGCSL